VDVIEPGQRRRSKARFRRFASFDRHIRSAADTIFRVIRKAFTGCGSFPAGAKK
jgi:hypothetical protein